jgi:WhiB family redox-sensing transcriptional regulator
MTSTRERYAWLDQAACAGRGAWWAVLSTSGERDDLRELVAICRRCPVKAECLEDAITHPDQHEVAGGLTANQRRALRARRRRNRRHNIRESA